MAIKAQVHTNAEIDNAMRALEIANPSLASAFDVLRVSLGIEADAPRDVWQVSRAQNRIGRNQS